MIDPAIQQRIAEEVGVDLRRTSVTWFPDTLNHFHPHLPRHAGGATQSILGGLLTRVVIMDKMPEELKIAALAHELTHVRQAQRGDDGYDPDIPYEQRPHEIEAHMEMARVANEITGRAWSPSRWSDHLGEWMDDYLGASAAEKVLRTIQRLRP